MSAATIHASAVLRRRAKGEEAGGGDGDAYWSAAPRLYDFSEHGRLKLDPSPPPPVAAPEKEPPPSPSPAPAPEHHLCLLALQGTGVRWGVRKRVRYVGRVPRRSNAAVPSAAAVSSAAVQGDEESSSNAKKNGGAGAGAAAAAGTETKKKKKRRRKPGRGRGFSLRPKKRVRGAANKAEVLEPPVAVAKEEESEQRQEEEEEEERKVKAVAEQRSKGRGCRLIKRLQEILPEVRKTMDRKAEESSQGDSKAAANKRSRPEPEAEESGEDERKTEKKTTAERHGCATAHRRKRSRRAAAEEEEEPGERKTKKPAAHRPKPMAGGGARRPMADHRWTAQRYASASASLLAVARAMGASASDPVQRGELRAEARKRIGDTGLLDHLLKHATGTVLPGGGNGGSRLRRRHNADGAMEYWLEPAELEALRREAGVADPYWVPPPGWKPGDPVSPDACARAAKKQVEALAAELAGVKRHMEQLMKANQGMVSNEVKSEAAKAYISHEPYYQQKYECMMKANVNLEKKVLSLEEKYVSAARSNGKLEQEVLSLKEKYEAVLENNARLESQMAALSNSYLSFKERLLLRNGDEQEGLLLLNDNGDQQQQVLLLTGPEQAPGDQGDRLCIRDSRDADEEESNGGGAGYRIFDAGDGAATSSGGGGKRTSRKCSVRICRPQGAFQWPDSSPLTPTAAAMAMDGGGGLALPPTPPSASSTNAASTKLLLLPPAPASPPTPSAAGTRDLDLDLQAEAAAVQPDSGHGQQLRQTSSWPCGGAAVLPEPKKTTPEAGGVGTELALATPSH